MGEKTIFTMKFPERIFGVSIKSDLIIFILALLLISIFIAYSYLVGVLIVIGVSFFFIPRIKIRSIDNSIKVCREVIKENKEIIKTVKTNEKYLLIIEDGFVKKSRHRIIFLYILAGVFLPLFLIINSSDPGPLLKSINILIYVTTLLIGLAIYDLRDIFEYFVSVIANNEEKLKSFEKLPIQLWNYYKKKWKITTIVTVILTISILFGYFSKKIDENLLINIPILYFVLLILLIHEIRKITAISLGLLRRYDDYIKSKLDLIYEPTLREKQNVLKDFINIFRAEFKTRFNERQKKSSKFIDKFKK